MLQQQVEEAWLRHVCRAPARSTREASAPPPSARALGRVVRAEVARLLTAKAPLPKMREPRWRITQWTVRLPREALDSFMLVVRLRSFVYSAACSVGAKIAALHVTGVEYWPGGSVTLYAAIVEPPPAPELSPRSVGGAGSGRVVNRTREKDMLARINVRWVDRAARRNTL